MLQRLGFRCAGVDSAEAEGPVLQAPKHSASHGKRDHQPSPSLCASVATGSAQGARGGRHSGVRPQPEDSANRPGGEQGLGRHPRRRQSPGMSLPSDALHVAFLMFVPFCTARSAPTALGEAGVHAQDSEGNVMVIFGAGAAVGISEVICGALRSTDLVAENTVETFVLPAKHFRALMASNTEVRALVLNKIQPKGKVPISGAGVLHCWTDHLWVPET